MAESRSSTNPSLLLDAIPQIGYDILVRLIPGATFLFLVSVIPHLLPASAPIFDPIAAAIPDGGAAWLLGFGASYLFGWLLSAFGQFWPPWERKLYPDMAEPETEDSIINLLIAAQDAIRLKSVSTARLDALKTLLNENQDSRLDYQIVRHLNPVVGARLLKLRAERHMLSTLRNAFAAVVVLVLFLTLQYNPSSNGEQTGITVEPSVILFCVGCLSGSMLAHHLSKRMGDQYLDSSRINLWLTAILRNQT